jgi:hypothetical protein
MEAVHRLTLVLALAVLGLAACGGVPPAQNIQPWVGRSAADLAREWGTPTRELPDKDQRILVYEEMVQTRAKDLSQDTSRRNAGAGPAPSITNFSSYARSYLFWVDASGKITEAKVREP